MKVMISIPMNGRKESEVKEEKRKIEEAFAKLHIEVVNSIFLEEPRQGEYNHEALYYIAKSIDVMGKVDAVYFVKDWQSARGCRIERQICEAYGVKILDYDFLDEMKNEFITRVNIPTIKFDRIVNPEEYKVTCENIPKEAMPY